VNTYQNIVATSKSQLPPISSKPIHSMSTQNLTTINKNLPQLSSKFVMKKDMSIGYRNKMGTGLNNNNSMREGKEIDRN
jgi:hypothetical protein